MNTQFRIKSLSFAVKSILIYGGITHVAWALDQENILNTSELPTITVTAIANDKTEGSGSYKANKSKSSSKLNFYKSRRSMDMNLTANSPQNSSKAFYSINIIFSQI